MTIEITGPAQKVPGRSVLTWWIIADVVFGIFLWLARVVGEVLVDWLWFSSVGYLPVFWTTLAAEVAVFAGTFVTTAIVLWLYGWLARRLARSPSTPLAAFGSQPPPVRAAMSLARLRRD